MIKKTKNFNITFTWRCRGWTTPP